MLFLAYSGIMDLLFAVVPWKIIMSLQMQYKERDWGWAGDEHGCIVSRDLDPTATPSSPARN